MNTRLTLAAAILAAMSLPALAGSASYYGAYAGSSITRNGHTTFTNSGGAYVGSATARGRTTMLTGANASRVGSVTRTGR